MELLPNVGRLRQQAIAISKFDVWTITLAARIDPLSSLSMLGFVLAIFSIPLLFAIDLEDVLALEEPLVVHLVLSTVTISQE